VALFSTRQLSPLTATPDLSRWLQHLTEHGALAACETDVAGEHELAACAARSRSDRRDGYSG